MSDPISCRAYAKHRGVSPMAVTLAIRAGRLVKSVVRDAHGDPKIADVALADQEWAANTNAQQRANAAGGDPAALVDRMAPVRPEPTPTAQPSENTLASAAARAKHWDAELKELKFREAAKELIPARDVERRMVDVFTSCKTHLLALPSRAKQALPHLSHADLEALDALVREALEELVTP